MTEADNAFAKIVAKAWRDPTFKAALIANPAAALKAEGMDVPAGMAVTVLENTDKYFHLVGRINVGGSRDVSMGDNRLIIGSIHDTPAPGVMVVERTIKAIPISA